MTPRTLSNYPLTVSWLLLAAFLGCLIAVWSDDLVPGFTIFTLVASVAISWRAGDAPVVPFVLLYQWVAITVGYWYQGWAGFFPSSYPPGNVELTVVLACGGLLLLALGIRLGTALLARRQAAVARPAEVRSASNLRGLFIVVLALYGIDYVVVLNTWHVANLNVILEQVLVLRQVLLLVLWLEVLRQRRGAMYVVITLAWVFVPRLGAYFSEFKSPFILLIIVFAAAWRPWESQWWRRGLVVAFKTSPAIAAALFLALLWQAGVKKETREAYDRQLVGSSPSERIDLFLDSAADAWPTLRDDPSGVVESLVERLSYITFFSRVLDHVPQQEPHARGELLQMALLNSAVPRFLYPEKPVLPSDSHYTRRFAGIMVPDEGTSISIGYMAEFYADWGVPGMMASVLGYGLWIGFVLGVARRVLLLPSLLQAALITIALRVLLFEHQFVKIFASLNVTAIVVVGFLVLFRHPLERFLGVSDPEAEARLDPVRAPDALPTK